jgi:hypothetical protein
MILIIKTLFKKSLKLQFKDGNSETKVALYRSTERLRDLTNVKCLLLTLICGLSSILDKIEHFR